MQPTTIEAVNRDRDLSAQARQEQNTPMPGPNLRDGQAQPDGAPRQSAAVGGGAVAGATTGALVGTAVAGPAGTVVGGVVGAVTGAAGGAALASGRADRPSDTIPGPQEREVTRDGEVHQEDLRR